MATPSPTEAGPPDGPTLSCLAEDLSARVRRAHATLGVDPAVLQDLDVAYEELRVAEEEARAQEEQIAQLLRVHETHRTAHERLLALLPVAVVVTDRHGVIRNVNAAAAKLAGQRPQRLVRKPVFVLFDAATRRPMRSLLARAAHADAPRSEPGVVRGPAATTSPSTSRSASPTWTATRWPGCWCLAATGPRPSGPV